MQTLKSRYTDAGFALKKAFIDNQSQRKKSGNFFIFLFFRPTDPSNFEKNPCSRKLNWSVLTFNFFFHLNIKVKKCLHVLFPCMNPKKWIILWMSIFFTNQSIRKVIFTCWVYTKYVYTCIMGLVCKYWCYIYWVRAWACLQGKTWYHDILHHTVWHKLSCHLGSYLTENLSKTVGMNFN